MIKHNQVGAVNGLVLSLILSVVLLLGALGFGLWAFSSRQDYKNHTDAKVNAAVKVAVARESAVKDKQFTEAEKNPLRTYTGPETLGSLVVQYPKTWSGYVDSTGSTGPALNGFFNPGVVPSVTAPDATFALHIQVLDQTYAQTLQNFTSLQQQGKLTISAYTLPKLPKVVGVKLTGALTEQKNGTLVILPLRSQTLEIETDGTQFLNDFNTYVLPNFSFSP